MSGWKKKRLGHKRNLFPIINRKILNAKQDLFPSVYTAQFSSKAKVSSLFRQLFSFFLFLGEKEFTAWLWYLCLMNLNSVVRTGGITPASGYYLFMNSTWVFLKGDGLCSAVLAHKRYLLAIKNLVCVSCLNSVFSSICDLEWKGTEIISSNIFIYGKK